VNGEHAHEPIFARFSRAAASYHPRARVQTQVADALLRLIEPGPPPDRVLEIGCGTGVLTERVLARWPAVRVDALDASEGMLARMRERFAGLERLRCMAGDVRTFVPERPYPVVFSSSALHWVFPVRDAVAGLRRLLARRGQAVLALMLDGTLCELHAVRRDIAPGKRPPTSLPSEPEVREALRSTGLTLETAQTAILREPHASAADFLQSLRLRGVTAGPVSVGAAPLARGELRRVIAEYQRRHAAADGTVHASYHVLYVRARFA